MMQMENVVVMDATTTIAGTVALKVHALLNTKKMFSISELSKFERCFFLTLHSTDIVFYCKVVQNYLMSFLNVRNLEQSDRENNELQQL
jgi:hypothetical protein